MKPFDIHLILGQDKSGEELANLSVTFQLKPQNIVKLCALAEFKGAVGDDAILKFDFCTQQGRQKECIEYFESGLDKQDGKYNHDLSPLQNWFMRPKKSGKLDIYESTKEGKEAKGQITLQYRFYKQAIESDSDLVQLSQRFQKSSFHPDMQLDVSFVGDVNIYKKNRIKIKMDYIEAHLTSNQFKMKDFQHLLKLLELFGDQEAAEEISKHPLFKFVQNTEQIQLKMKMSSIRKMLGLYQIGLTEQNTIKERKKQYPQIIKGLFKQQLRVTMVYGSTIALVAKYRFKSEAVLIRILTGIKKYHRYFE